MLQPSSRTPVPVVRTDRVMGTVASVHVFDDVEPGLIEAAAAGVLEELWRLEAMFSTYRDDSEISRINAGTLDLVDASAEVVDVLDACTWLEQASGGAFDIRPHGAGGCIDPAGFVKGWAAERAAASLHRAGLQNWYVSVGGDVILNGAPSAGQQWTVGVADPHRQGALRATLRMPAGAVATSGTAERGLHLWDARNGSAATALASVTVTGPSLTWADAFATTVFVMGEEGLSWIERFDEYHAVVVRCDGSVQATSAVRCGEHVL